MTASVFLLVSPSPSLFLFSALPDFSPSANFFQGHEKHEWTSGVAIESVFKFLFAREAVFTAGEDPNDKNYDGMSSSSSEEAVKEEKTEEKPEEK
jgi:hypothetical protein